MNVHSFVSKGERRFKDKNDWTAELQVEGMKIVINMETVKQKNTLCSLMLISRAKRWNTTDLLSRIRVKNRDGKPDTLWSHLTVGTHM